MKALITGGSGFIGTHLISYLLNKNYEVVVVDQETHVGLALSDVAYYTCDIKDKALGTIFEAERPDVIFHLAAQSSVPVSMTNPYQDAKTNVMGTVHLLDHAVRYNVSKIIFASSAAVYGIPEQLPIGENHPIQPTSFYGLSKAIGENYIKMYGGNSLIEYAILRFSNVYGPGQHMGEASGFITKSLYSALEDQPIHIYGDGLHTRDFIFVEDIVRACEKAIYSTGIYNISSNSAVSINQIIGNVEKIIEKPLNIHYVNNRPGDIIHSRLENTKAIKNLSWHPLYSIEKGLQTTLKIMESKVFKGV